MLKIKKNLFLDILFNIDYIIASLSLILLVGCTVAGVIMRYFLGNPFQWLEEMSTTLFVWFIFLGAAPAVRARSHVSIDIFVDMLPQKARKIIDIFGYIIVVLLLVGLIYYGSLLSWQAVEKITPILKIPYRYVNLPLPVGAFLMLISYTVMFIQKMTGFIAYEDNTGKEDVL